MINEFANKDFMYINLILAIVLIISFPTAAMDL